MSSYQAPWGDMEEAAEREESFKALRLTEHLYRRGVRSNTLTNMHGMHRANHAIAAGVHQPNERLWNRVTRNLEMLEND